MRKTFQELDLKDSFLFAAALEDQETCRMILQVILGVPVEHVTVHAEHSIMLNSDYRSIRLDIYASDEAQVEYNLEMQNENSGNLAKRSRYYQAEMDVSSLKPGEGFEQMKPSYVIFICTFDPFGRKLYRYTFENRCLEQNFSLEDGTKKIFLNTKGENLDQVSEVLVKFLRYVENSTDEYAASANDPIIQNIHGKITRLKKSREWEGKYMRFDELIRNSEKKGEKYGQERTLKLVKRMMEDGQAGQVERLLQEPDFLKEMLEKYQL